MSVCGGGQSARSALRRSASSGSPASSCWVEPLQVAAPDPAGAGQLVGVPGHAGRGELVDVGEDQLGELGHRRGGQPAAHGGAGHLPPGDPGADPVGGEQRVHAPAGARLAAAERVRRLQGRAPAGCSGRRPAACSASWRKRAERDLHGVLDRSRRICAGEGAGVAGHLGGDRADRPLGDRGQPVAQRAATPLVEVEVGRRAAVRRSTGHRHRLFSPNKSCGSIHLCRSRFYAAHAATLSHMTTTVPRRPDRAVACADRLLRLAERSPPRCCPADYLDLVAPLRSGADLRGRIVEVQPETARRGDPGDPARRGWRGHVPGQYVRHRRRRRRRAAVAGLLAHLRSPRADGRIAITVKAIPDGKVSNHLVRRARPGTLVQLDQAAGRLRAARGDARQGAVRHRRQRHHPGDGHAAQPCLRTGRRRRRRACTRAPHRRADVDLRRRAARARPSRARSGWSSGTPTPTGCSTSHDLDDARARPRRAGDLGLRARPACSTRSRQHWTTRGVADRLHTERFRPTVIVAGEGGTVTFTGSGTAVEADGATPLLDAGEEAGVLMPSGCRMGICFGCVAAAARGRRARPAHRRPHHRRRPATACSSRPACRPRPAPATSTSDTETRR